MSQLHLIKLGCQECKNINYWSRRNKKQDERKRELKKFCKNCRTHQMHKELKK